VAVPAKLGNGCPDPFSYRVFLKALLYCGLDVVLNPFPETFEAVKVVNLLERSCNSDVDLAGDGRDNYVDLSVLVFDDVGLYRDSFYVYDVVKRRSRLDLLASIV